MKDSRAGGSWTSINSSWNLKTRLVCWSRDDMYILSRLSTRVSCGSQPQIQCLQVGLAVGQTLSRAKLHAGYGKIENGRYITSLCFSSNNSRWRHRYGRPEGKVYREVDIRSRTPSCEQLKCWYGSRQPKLEVETGGWQLARRSTPYLHLSAHVHFTFWSIHTNLTLSP